MMKCNVFEVFDMCARWNAVKTTALGTTKEPEKRREHESIFETINICPMLVDGFSCKVNLKSRPKQKKERGRYREKGKKGLKIMRRDRRVLLNYGVAMTLQWEHESNRKQSFRPHTVPNCPPRARVSLIDVGGYLWLLRFEKLWKHFRQSFQNIWKKRFYKFETWKCYLIRSMKSNYTH